MRTRHLAAFAALALLSACGRLIPEGRPPVTPPLPAATSALTAGVKPGPALAGFGLSTATAAPALASFIESCPRLVRRTDSSGLTRGADWQAACTSAAAWPQSDAQRFFADHFETALIGDGNAFVTGYYEPEIAGVRTRQPGFDVPVYRLPPDLVRAKVGEAPPNPNGTQPLGRYDESGQFVPYHDRAAIDAGALANKGLELGWAADPVEMFFVQIQGSGRLRAPDGSVVRIGYAGQNGQPYTSIGAVMRAHGLVGTGPGQYPGTMQGIMQYVREHPADGRALLEENKSWVFFREMTTNAPVGALGVPVRPKVTLAADPAFVPLGAPVLLTVDQTEASGLWVAQDTGGAIKGANRFDSFWGAGDQARLIAGRMSARGQAVVLLPKGTLSRLGVR